MFDKVMKQKELIKTIAITILITAVIAFIAGIKSHERYQAGINKAREEAKASIVQTKVEGK
jgi:hypothetical protein